jgi:hypothetical protein
VQVEEKGSHALAALKDSQQKAQLALASMTLEARFPSSFAPPLPSALSPLLRLLLAPSSWPLAR